MAKKVIFNADGFGLHSQINSAIIELALDHKISSTSVIVTTPFWKEDIGRLKKLENFSIGVHLNITLGKSLLGHAKLPLLTNNDGTFKFSLIELMHKIEFSTSFDLINEITLELDAQLKIAQEFFEATHFDGHLHVHSLPAVNLILQKIAHKLGFTRCRSTHDRFFGNPFHKVFRPMSLLKYIFIQYTQIHDSDYFKTPDEFRGFYFHGRWDATNLLRTLDKLHENTISEFSFFPSKNIELTKPLYSSGMDRWLQSSARYRELITLREFVLPEEFDMVSYKQL